MFAMQDLNTKGACVTLTKFTRALVRSHCHPTRIFPPLGKSSTWYPAFAWSLGNIRPSSAASQSFMKLPPSVTADLSPQTALSKGQFQLRPFLACINRAWYISCLSMFRFFVYLPRNSRTRNKISCLRCLASSIWNRLLDSSGT